MDNKKKLAAKILKISPKKVRFSSGALEEIKKAITRADIRGLIAVKKIRKVKKNQHSLGRARKISAQKRKGRQKGRGSKRGKKFSVVSRKENWMSRIRTQRKLLQELRRRGILKQEDYKLLYLKSKGGYFRSKRHIKLYLTEHKLVQKSIGDQLQNQS